MRLPEGVADVNPQLPFGHSGLRADCRPRTAAGVGLVDDRDSSQSRVPEDDRALVVHIVHHKAGGLSWICGEPSSPSLQRLLDLGPGAARADGREPCGAVDEADPAVQGQLRPGPLSFSHIILIIN